MPGGGVITATNAHFPPIFTAESAGERASVVSFLAREDKAMVTSGSESSEGDCRYLSGFRRIRWGFGRLWRERDSLCVKRLVMNS